MARRRSAGVLDAQYSSSSDGSCRPTTEKWERSSRNSEAFSSIPRKAPASLYRLCDRNVLAEIHVLNEVEHFDALFHGSLEGLSAGDEAHAAGALVDDGGFGRVCKVVLARCAATVDQGRPAQ